ncbi:MAG TPA: heterodisulfide reductase subunit F [Chloroflexi bacterium]|nr:heterodisulfide reductase subunit F [Chloroflexota bacterium]
MTIEDIREETPDIRTYRLAFRDPEVRRGFSFLPGQFGVFSVFGQGEAPFGLANAPSEEGIVECSIKRVGKVTTAFEGLDVGDTVGFRGPYGRAFPVEEMKGKNLLFIGGGIGMAPLRSLLWHCLNDRAAFGDISLLYGARSVADLVYKAELEEWRARGDMSVLLTVDPGGEDAAWTGKIGFVPTVLEEVAPSAANAVAITCGPPIMIRFVLATLTRLGFEPEQIITTLESKMKCGLGKCGRCNIGGSYVCKHGPVYSYRELLELPEF